MRVLLAALSLGIAFAATSALATPLDAALGALHDGRLRLEFATRAGVYGDGRSLVTHGHSSRVFGDCCDQLEAGPAIATLVVRAGVVIEVDVRVGRRHRLADTASITRDLGEVASTEAASFLLKVAEDARGGDVDEAVMGASIAEGFDDWARVVALARANQRPRGVRKAAIFWLGQAASAVATRELTALVDDENTELQLREHAIFALSQRESDECIEPLTRVATSSRHPQLREKALFWLAQLDDPRVVDVFERILVEK